MTVDPIWLFMPQYLSISGALIVVPSDKAVASRLEIIGIVGMISVGPHTASHHGVLPEGSLAPVL